MIRRSTVLRSAPALVQIGPDFGGELVSTGRLEWRWHAGDARYGPVINVSKTITADNDAVAGRIGFDRSLALAA